MAQEIELPDGSIAEFPDDMDDDQINAVLSKQFPPSNSQVDLVELSQPASAMERFGRGLMDPVHGAAQIADKLLVDPIRQRLFPGASNMNDVTRERDRENVPVEGFDVARMAGNVANPVSWAGGGAGPLRAAVSGAIQGGLSPIPADSTGAVGTKGQQMLLGAGGGLVLQKALGGFRPSADAQTLMRHGVQPTFGQSIGGMVNAAEQKLTSLPLVGDAINFARGRAQREFEAALLQRATGQQPLSGMFGQPLAATRQRTVGEIVGDTVRAARGQPAAQRPLRPTTLDEANTVASQQFDRVVPRLSAVPQWASDIVTVTQRALANPEMTDANRQIFRGLFSQYFDPKRIAQLSPDGLKDLDSQFGYLIRKYQGGDPAAKTMADELRNVQATFRGELDQMLPPDMTGALNEANRTYARLVPANKAASARADERITPRAMQKALARQAGRDVSRMPDDDLVDAAVRVLPTTIPDSGTVGRAMLGGGTLIGSQTLGLLPEVAATGTLAGLGAMRPVQRALTGNTTMQRTLLPYDAQTTAAILAALRGQTQGQKR